MEFRKTNPEGFKQQVELSKELGESTVMERFGRGVRESAEQLGTTVLGTLANIEDRILPGGSPEADLLQDRLAEQRLTNKAAFRELDVRNGFGAEDIGNSLTPDDLLEGLMYASGIGALRVAGQTINAVTNMAKGGVKNFMTPRKAMTEMNTEKGKGMMQYFSKFKPGKATDEAMDIMKTQSDEAPALQKQNAQLQKELDFARNVSAQNPGTPIQQNLL